jgi:hypothetical protein
MENMWLPLLLEGLKETYQVLYERTRRNKDDVKKSIFKDILNNRVILLPITKVKEEDITDDKIKEVIKLLKYQNIEAAFENNYDFSKIFRPKNLAKTKKIIKILKRIEEIIKSLESAPLINYKVEIIELIKLIIELGKLLEE